MRRSELAILRTLRRDGPLSVTELADAIDKNQGWISELVQDLERQNLVEKNRRVALEDTYEARLLTRLLDAYDVDSLLVGTREEILTTLLDRPKTVTDLELAGFAKTTVYDALGDFRESGVVSETDDGYRLSDETLEAFLTARIAPRDREVTADGETIIRAAPDDDVEGRPTAFSAFTRYGVDYYPAQQYCYRGARELELEDVLIHAVAVADTPRQMGICAVFSLTHSRSLDPRRLWELARKWDCVERWADLQAFLDRRDVRREASFPSWDEFVGLANEYGVYPREKYPEEPLLEGIDAIGEIVDEPLDAYLLGGGNLLLRGLKDSTKDVDLVVAGQHERDSLVDALREGGFEERTDVESAYEELDPSIVLTRDGSPNWDIFVERVAGKLHLTDSMQRRADETVTYGNVTLHLLSLTDIFLFKSVTDREGDLEDAALLARQGHVDWDALFDEVKAQESVTGRQFSFDVLDTLDLIEVRDGVRTPIHRKLLSHCLEHALLLTLEEPKTIRDIRDTLDFPDHQLYNKLRTLEADGRVQVDRSGTLNTYEAV